MPSLGLQRGLLLALMSVSAAAAMASPAYTISVVPNYGQTTSACLTNSGLMAGSRTVVGQPTFTACYFNESSIHDIGTIGLQATGNAVNDAGQVTGTAYTASATAQHAFYYSGGVMTDIGTLGGTNSFASAINSSGQVVGRAQNSQGKNRAFIYSNGVISDLGAFSDGYSEAYAINDNGHVVGTSRTSTDWQSFIYRNGSMENIDPTSQYSIAGGINIHDQVIGSREQSTPTGTRSQAYLYSNGSMTIIPNLGTGNESRNGASGINDSGDVVGSYTDNNGGLIGGFLYSKGATLDLTGLLDPTAHGWRVTEADAINNRGWILAVAYNAANQRSVVLLKPVPEPASFLALGLGAFGLLRRRKSKQVCSESDARFGWPG